MIIGITGNTGSGKTEISKIISKKINAKIINADEEVKRLSEPGNKYYEKIVDFLGISILKNKKINKEKLAQIIYSNQKIRKKINKLTNKYVVKEIKNKIKEEKTNIILDVPLLFESKLDKMCDITIAILAEEEIKLTRICKRDNISYETAKARLNIQETDEFYKKRADIIINNNGKKEEINLEEICTKIGEI